MTGRVWWQLPKQAARLGDVAGHEAQPRGELDESELNNQRDLLLT